MAITQGGPLPDITQVTSTEQITPDYYTDYLSSLSEAGQTAMGRTPEQTIAGYDPLQDLGYAGVESAAGAYQPGLTAAGQNIADVASGLDTSRISQLMDPYTQNVVDEMERLSQQNVQRNLLPMMKGAFVGTGGLGGQRYAGALGQSLADIQASLTGQQYGALSKGYQSALDAALKEMDARSAAATRQAAIAGQEQEMGLLGSEALRQAGAERQAYEQSLLDAPLKTATTASGLMRGFQVPTTTEETFVGPKAGLYQKSDLEQILGAMSMLGAIRPQSKEGTSLLGSVLKAVPSALELFRDTDLDQYYYNPDYMSFYDQAAGDAYWGGSD